MMCGAGSVFWCSVILEALCSWNILVEVVVCYWQMCVVVVPCGAEDCVVLRSFYCWAIVVLGLCAVGSVHGAGGCVSLCGAGDTGAIDQSGPWDCVLGSVVVLEVAWCSGAL